MDVSIPKSISASTFSRASPASYYSSVGLLTYASNNILRVGYDPLNLSATPLPVIESIASNAIDCTEDMQGGFSLTALGVGYHAAKAPDGTYTAHRYVETAANSTHSLSKVVSAVSSPTSFSVYAKAGTRTSVYIRVQGGGSVDQTTTFDLSAGTYNIISNGTPAGTASIQSVGSGWYRCIVSQQTVGGTISFGIYNGATSYAGDGVSSVYFWGSQLEIGSATSYIPSVQTYVSGGGTRYRTNSSGVLAVSTNAARQEFTADNLALASKLIVEPTVTNLLQQSVALDASAWTKTSVGLNSTTAVDPTTTNNTGRSYNGPSPGTLGSISQAVTVANDSLMRVFSVFIAKTGTAIWPGISVEYTGGTSQSGAISINTLTGAVNTSTLFSAASYVNVRSYPNFWRVSIGVVNNSSGNTTATVKLYPSVNNNGSTSWTGHSSTAIFWCSQFEVGYSETSPIVTAGAAVTANAEVFTSTASTRQADTNTFGLIYTNIPENDFPVWSAATTYGVDVSGSNSVIYNHVKYASLQASNTNRQPDTSPTWWSVIDATNAYAMFDGKVITQTVGTVGGHIIAYIQVNTYSTLSFLNVSADTISVKVYSNYQEVSSSVIDFTGGSTGVPITDYTLTGISPTSNTYVKIDVYSATTAPAIGNFLAGTNYYLGSTETNPTLSITDYSIKNVDAFGNPTLTKRGFAKRMSTKQLLDDSEVDKVARIMAMVRATPCVWNANTTMRNLTSNLKTSLIVYGYYKDWEITASVNKSYLTATIEGLV